MNKHPYAPTWRTYFDETAVNDATAVAWNKLSANEQKLLSALRRDLINTFNGLGVMGSRELLTALGLWLDGKHIGDVV